MILSTVHPPHVTASSIGILAISNGLLGVGEYGFFFEAVGIGNDGIGIKIDGDSYSYSVKVSK